MPEQRLRRAEAFRRELVTEGMKAPRRRNCGADGLTADMLQILKKIKIALKINEKFLYCFKTSIIMFRTAKFTLFQGWGKNAAVLETPVGL